MKFKALLHYFNRRDHHLLPKNFNFTKVIFVLAICFTATFFIKVIFAAGTETKTTTISTFGPEITALEEKEESMQDTNINAEVWGKEYDNTWKLYQVQSLIGTRSAEAVKGTNGWIPGGIIGTTNKAIASLYNPPASGIEYIASSINSFMGKPVYADETGFTQLKGIQSLWKLCRNAVYTIISIFFVAIGIMIMLRIKISPQATVTIQNSIPKIITTLILVTFSYAICGLIIDLTYLIQAFILSLLTQSNTTLFSNNLSLPNLVKGSWDTHWNLVMQSMNNSNFSTTGWVITILGGTVGAIIGAFAGGPWGGIGGLILGLLILVIFAFIQLAKFFFGCAKAYLILLLKIISAPLEIALGIFPNSKMGFGSWFIQTIAYASVFPICLIFLVFLNIVLNAVSLNQLWTPGILQGSFISPFIGGIIALAGLMLLAKLPSLIPEAIFQLKPSPFGKALGQNIFTGIGNSVKQGASLKFGSWSSGLVNQAYGGIRQMHKTSLQTKSDMQATKKVSTPVKSNTPTRSTPPNLTSGDTTPERDTFTY